MGMIKTLACSLALGLSVSVAAQDHDHGAGTSGASGCSRSRSPTCSGGRSLRSLRHLWAMAIAFSVMSMVSAWLFRRGGWKLKRV